MKHHEVLNNELHFLVSKLEAAERQLDQAIRLLFRREDAVSIHTLAAAAYQVISDICEKKGIPREIEDSVLLTELGIKRELIADLRKPQNFFKHADKQASQTVKLKPMQSAILLMYCVQHLLQLRATQSPECRVFRTWFFLLRPDTVPLNVREQFGLNKMLIDVHDYDFFNQAIELDRNKIHQ